ncbi:Cyclin-dependent kinase-like, partial [Perkinsus olseni]
AMTMTIGRQLVAGLGYIHSKGVIHRDVKPENILLTGERLDVVKLCDFGFARYLKEADTSPSKEGARHAAAANLTEYVSTRWYRAPELLLGPGGKRGKGKNGNYEQSIDVWALGCVVAECDTGEPAFTGDSDVATLKLINDALPVPLPATRRRAVLSAQGQRTPQFITDRYSPRLHPFLEGCLQYSPSERLACVDLAPLLVGLPDSAVALDSGQSRTLSQSHQRVSKRERSGILSCEADAGLGQPSGLSKRRRSDCLVRGRLATTPIGSEPSTSASGLSSSSPRPTPNRRKYVCDSRERRRLAVLASVPPPL